MTKYFEVILPITVAEKIAELNHGRIGQAHITNLSELGAKLIRLGFQAHSVEEVSGTEDGVLFHIPRKLAPLFADVATSSREMPEMPSLAQGFVNAALEIIAQAERAGLENRFIDLENDSVLFFAPGKIPKVIKV